MTAVEVLHRDNDFRLLRTQEDPADNAYWCFMHAQRFSRDTSGVLPVIEGCSVDPKLRAMSMPSL